MNYTLLVSGVVAVFAGPVLACFDEEKDALFPDREARQEVHIIATRIFTVSRLIYLSTLTVVFD